MDDYDVAGSTGSGEKVLPHSMEAEVAILGSLLLGGVEACEAISDTGLDAKHFYREGHREIFSAAMEMVHAGERVDHVLLAERLRSKGILDSVGGSARLAELELETPSSKNCEEYARIVMSLSRKRELVEAGTRMMGLGYDMSMSAEDGINQAQRMVSEIEDSSPSDTWVSVEDLMPEVMTGIYRRLDGERSGLDTGFEKLDDILGGLRPGEVAIVAGRPGMGKTSMVSQIALSVARGDVPVGIFSLEMSRQQILEKMVFIESEVPAWKIEKRCASQEEVARLGEAAGSVCRLPIDISAVACYDDQDIIREARKLKRRRNIGLLIIDYVQLIERKGRTEGLVGDMTAVSRSIKLLARTLNIPIIALSQLSRATESKEDKRPGMSDLRQSGGLEQDAAAIIMLYRDEYYTREKSQKPGICEFIVRKNRFGAEGSVEYRFESECTRFSETT